MPARDDQHRTARYGSTNNAEEEIPLTISIPLRNSDPSTARQNRPHRNATSTSASAGTSENGDSNVNMNVNTNGDANEDIVEDVDEEDENQNQNGGANDVGEARIEDTVTGLTNRLRCLFVMLTLPILPLGSALALLLLFLMHAAFVSDSSHECSHPLKAFALVSWVLCVYTPNHSVVKLCLFQYSRDRDGPMPPRAVRIYDQLFHTLCLFYVYSGYTLVNSCRSDLIHSSTNAQPSSIVNTCQETCPQLYKVTVIYVGTLQLFTFVLLMPLIFLPCIYLYILRRASNAATLLQQTIQGHQNLNDDDNDEHEESVTAWDIINAMDTVQLIRPKNSETNHSDTLQIQMMFLPKKSLSNQPKDQSDLGQNDHDQISHPQNIAEQVPHTICCDLQDVKDCCICMGEFTIIDDDTDETLNEVREVDTKDEIVRTKCGHLFHKSCIGRWIGGNWNLDQSSGRRRRAKRKFCPLCREDLTPNVSTGEGLC